MLDRLWKYLTLHSRQTTMATENTEAKEKATRGTIGEIVDMVHTVAEAEGLEYSKRVSDVYTHIVMRVLVDVLAQKKTVIFPTGLSLKPVLREPRTGRNPQKPDEILNIPAQWVIKAKAGAGLKARLNPKETY